MEINEVTKQMDNAILHVEQEFIKIRTGRANPAILDKVKVDAYGNLTPLNQVALINVAEATQLVIKAYDSSLLKEIEVGISKASLDLNPINDGEVIRINIPPLTEETRKTFVKEAKKKAEEAKVTIRNIRKDSNNKIKKNEELTADEKVKAEAKIQELTNKYNKIVEDKLVAKENDIMTI